MPKFRKKPVEIEAMQLGDSPASLTAIIEWAAGHGVEMIADHDGQESHCLRIPTLEGTMTASVGDWIIKGVRNEFYPCKPHIFAQTYEAV